MAQAAARKDGSSCPKVARMRDERVCEGALASAYGAKRAPLSFGELLRTRLRTVDINSNATWAEKLVELLINEALTGNLRAIQEVINRADGDRELQRVSLPDISQLDDATAGKVLEAICAEGDDMPSD